MKLFIILCGVIFSFSALAQDVSYFHGPATIIGGKSSAFKVMTKVSHLPAGVKHEIIRYSTKDKTGIAMEAYLRRVGNEWYLHTDPLTVPDADYKATVVGSPARPSLIEARGMSTTQKSNTLTLKISETDSALETVTKSFNEKGVLILTISAIQAKISKDEFEKIKGSIQIRSSK